ncbi:T9SS type A sorting domain-containing protein, partial [Robiginitalea aurantiaca]
AAGSAVLTWTTGDPDGPCVGDNDSMTVTINEKGDPIFDPVAPICEGGDLASLPTTSTNGITGTWSPALDNTQTTEYTFTPADGECANEAKLTITVTDKVDPTFDPVGPICEGDYLAPLPTVSRNGIPGSWSPALDNTQTTEYTFTPAEGECANPAKLTIVVNEKPDPHIDEITLCAGESYTWPVNQVTYYADNGSTMVTVEGEDCEADKVLKLTVPIILTCNIKQDKLATNHLTSDGVATVHPMGGTAPFTYHWDNGETTQTASSLKYGMHTVTVKDANGCETTCQIDIAKELYCWTTLISNVTVFGGNDGVARVQGNGGYRPYSYEWDDGTIGSENKGLSAGTHYVTITDATGATSKCSVDISQPSKIDCDKLTCNVKQDKLATNHLTSDGVATVHPIGGTAPFTYHWDNGETTQTAYSLTYGMHTVTVKDANGCETTCQIDIAKELYCWTNPISNVTVYGGNDGAAKVQGNGGYRPYTYKWDDGTIGSENNGLTAGTHYVTITDATGATSKCSVDISQPNDNDCDKLTSSVKQDKLATNHLTSDGVATVYPMGGTAPFTYHWDNGETTQTAYNLTYGMHTVTVKDASGCETTCQVDIAKELYCWTTLISNVTVFGGNDGAASVQGNGGYRPYAYKWDDGTTGSENTGLTAGIHYVTITDAIGATSQCSVLISQPEEKVCDEFTSSIKQDKLATNHHTSDGVATVHLMGGTAPFTYHWDNGETTQTAYNLTYGMHTVTVKDANGCETTCQVDIAKELNCWTTLISNVTVFGGNDGVASVQGNGGYHPYTYKWDDGTTGSENRELTAGIHYVTITDATGATSQCNVTISQPQEEVCDGMDNDNDGMIDEGFDQDNDGVADCFDDCDDRIDTDMDGVPDCIDKCAGFDDTIDSDNDGIPDGCDNCDDGDDDGDGVKNCDDICSAGDDNLDTDGDGTPDACDTCNDDGDDDGDGVKNCDDICSAGDDNLDTDGDGTPDACDTCNDDGDDDGDGVKNCDDICSAGDDNLDTDGDGTPDACDTCSDDADDDGDGVKNCDDICSAGDDNLDTDGDGTPDACDTCNDDGDDDGDGVKNCDDICSAGDDNLDTDGDGTPDACDIEVCDGVDNDGDGDIDEDLNCSTGSIDKCETAFAKLTSSNAICFEDISGFDSPRWGWTNLIPATDGTTTMDLYAAAAQCDITKGALIGEVEVTYLNGSIDVTVSTVPGVIMTVTQLYAGTDKLPTGNNGSPTVAPGQYPYAYEPGNEFTKHTFTGISVNNAVDGFYVILHAEVCPEGTTARSVYQEAMEVKAYPVPFKQELNLNVNIADDAQYLIQIFDANGRMIKNCGIHNLRKGENNLAFSAGDIASGMYFVRLSAGSQNKSVRVVRE